jgi:hypothetical protein
MATKKKTAPPAEESTGENETLQKTAKAIGSALGSIAVKTGLAHPPAPGGKVGKLPAKNKKRLPRKEKKMAHKAAANGAAGAAKPALTKAANRKK